MNLRLSMIVLAGASRLTIGFTSPFQRFRNSTQRLHASLFEDLQKNFANTFSTMSVEPKNDSKYYTVGITGASGLVGTALRDELKRRQKVNGKPVRVVKLARGDSVELKLLEDTTVTTLKWNPKGISPEDVIDPSALKDMDAIIHLAGENVATGTGPLGFLGIRPWTDDKKKEIIESRVSATKALSKAINASSSTKQFLVASGIGAYGNNFIGDTREAVDETVDCSKSEGFLAVVSREIESASEKAKKGNNRVVKMRFGVVLSTKGGALGKLYPIFLLGGGGVVGTGDQYFSFISARDIARAIIHTLETPSLDGPVNFSAPFPCTNAEFTSALGKVLRRPTILPFPGFAVSLLFGEMGEEMLLGGVRAKPGKLVQSGFQFQHKTIEQALRSALEESI